MNTETTLTELLAERDEIADKIARAIDTATKRHLAARKAHLTRKINAMQTAPLAPTATRPSVSIDAPMTNQQILTEARAMLAEHGLTGWTVKLSNIMTKTYGCCDYAKREIRIAARVAALNPAAETRNTIAHEVAHALAGPGTGHGPAWKAQCAVTGARPDRCHTAETVKTSKRYRGVCEACGEHVTDRVRLPKPTHRHYHPAGKCAAAGSGVRSWIRWEDTRS